MSITIILEGGIVQCVVSKNKKLIGQGYDVVDYDTEGCETITKIKQGYKEDPELSEDAYVYGGNVTKSRITIGRSYNG